MFKSYKNFIFSLITFLIIVLFFELCVRTLIHFKKEQLFQSKEKLEFYKKYINSLNHMRDASINPEDAQNYLFNYILQKNSKENEFNTILFQGDSQTEGLNFLEKETLEKLFNNKDTIVNAGTTSYSPSLMSVQFDILVNDFKLRPNIVVAIIDSTDIGDENCRYKELTKIKNNKIIKVKKVEERGEFYFYENNFLFSEIYLSKFPKIIYIPKIINHFIKYNLNTVSNCKFDTIQNYLVANNKLDQDYFKFILETYINNVSSYDFVKKLYIVSFPHIQHYDKKYYGIKYNVKTSDLINSIELNSKVVHLNFFEDEIFKEYNSDLFKVYLKNDPASHLTKKGKSIFFNKIMKKIN